MNGWMDKLVQTGLMIIVTLLIPLQPRVMNREPRYNPTVLLSMRRLQSVDMLNKQTGQRINVHGFDKLNNVHLRHIIVCLFVCLFV